MWSLSPTAVLMISILGQLPAGMPPASFLDPSSCVLAPEVAAVAEQCRELADPPDYCLWFPIFDSLGAGNLELAAEQMEFSFGLSGDMAEDLVMPLGFFLMEALEEKSLCKQPLLVSLLEAMTTLEKGPWTLFFETFLRRLPPGTREFMAERIPDHDLAQLARAGAAIEQLNLKTGVRPFGSGMGRHFGPNPGQIRSYIETFADDRAPKIRDVLQIRQSFTAGKIAEARSLIAAHAADSGTAGAHFQTLLGNQLYTLGFHEDALLAVRRARSIVQKSDPSEEDCYFGIIAEWLEFRILEDLGRDPEESKALGRPPMPEAPLSPLLRAFLPRNFDSGIGPSIDSIIQRSAPYLEALRQQPESMAALGRAAMTILPGILEDWLPARPDPDRYLQWRQLEIIQKIQRGELAQAEPLWESLVREYPEFDSLRFLGPVILGMIKASRYEDAMWVATKAIDFLQSYREQIRSHDAVKWFDHKHSYIYFRLATVIAGLTGNAPQAFELAERSRAFALSRDLGDPPLRPASRTASSREREVEMEITRAERSSLPAEKRKLAFLYKSFETARFDRLLTSLESVAARPMKPIELTALQREILHPGESMLSYFEILENGEGYLLLQIDPERSDLLLLEGAAPSADCLSQLAYWRNVPQGLRRVAEARGAHLLGSCAEGELETDPISALSEALTAPFAGQLATNAGQLVTNDRLIIVPHGELHRVPFAAMRHPLTGRRLIEDHELAIEPSADIFARLRKRSAAAKPARRGGARRGQPLVLGDPTTPFTKLPAARGEAEAVAKLLGVRPLLGDAASEAALFRQAPTATVLHIAAHGTYVPESPLFSAIQLAEGGGQDGSLHVHEVWDRLDLRNVRLVVLSACDTAAGEPTRGDEILGLTQAFLVAGAPAVIATLWPVDDAASARLMTEFYRRFQKGETASAALRAAQLVLLADPQTAAPYYWAGYTLVGDPDARWQIP